MPSLFSALQAVLKRWFGAPSQQPMSADAPASEISANDLQNTSMQAEEYTQHHSQIVPYDENLLERSRTQWQFGDWESLAQLSRDTLQHHPDRAKLALLAAAGLLQTGETAVARQYIRLAQDWGCNKKLISQILVAGVHNSLGRAAAVGGQEQRALGHFENAIATGMPGGIFNYSQKHGYLIKLNRSDFHLYLFLVSTLTAVHPPLSPNSLTPSKKKFRPRWHQPKRILTVITERLHQNSIKLYEHFS